jgi:hypothetical protein
MGNGRSRQAGDWSAGDIRRADGDATFRCGQPLAERLTEEDDAELLAYAFVQAAQLGGPTTAYHNAAAVGYALSISDSERIVLRIDCRVAARSRRWTGLPLGVYLSIQSQLPRNRARYTFEDVCWGELQQELSVLRIACQARPYL